MRFTFISYITSGNIEPEGFLYLAKYYRVRYPIIFLRNLRYKISPLVTSLGFQIRPTKTTFYQQTFIKAAFQCSIFIFESCSLYKTDSINGLQGPANSLSVISGIFIGVLDSN